MKHNLFFNELTISIILVILLVLFLNPLDFLMPSSFVMMLIVFLIAFFGIFTAVIWREQPKDEREGFHSMFAGRLAFLTGSTILVIGIIMQELRHVTDQWLIFALVGMIIAKIVGFLYGQKKY